MGETVRFGIVGTGVGATFFARAFSLIASEGIAELVTVTSRRESRAKEYAEKWRLKSWYTDHTKMIEKEDIDAVIVSTPHYLHHPIAMDAIKAGKHVLVDKPIAINLREADEMINEAERRGLKLGVNLQSRFDPTYRKLKEAVDAGRFGRLILGEAIVKWFRDQEYYDRSPWRGKWATEGGGALINQAIHTIDLLVWIMGPVDYLWAQMDTVAHKIEVEDIAVSVIRFKNGAIGLIEGSTALYPGFPTRLEIHGVKGTALVEGEVLKRWSIIGEEEITKEERKEGLASWSRPELVPPKNHASLLRDFAKAILEDRKPYVDGVEGRKSLEIIRAIYKSSETQDVIRFPLTE
ncbi:gfo/Idh/MocA family oxidoreductase [Candidatus Bathyarchaeota archaeon]|nr:MAG: gfo/Idh/MocA family oxidoreductase [Candidatus Bathyarchaeota archaeon]